MAKNAQTSKRFVAWLVVSIMVFALGMPVQFANAESNLSDIAGHWASKQISDWVDQGIVKGYPDGTFKPNNSITRAEFAVLVNKSFKFNDTAAIDFKDVQANDWFYEEIAKAKKAGYMGGYEDGTIKPNAPISRQEVATIFTNIKNLNANESAADKFTDAAKIPAWSKGFIGAVADAGYMGGYPDKSFQPTKNITRAEAIVALNNVVVGKVEGPKEDPKEDPKEENKVAIEKIDKKSVKINNTIDVTVKVDPEDAEITIKNSDDEVVKATLDSNKIELKGLQKGEATITVTAKKDGLEDAEATFKVEVYRSSGGGGGGGGSSSGGSSITKPSKADIDALKAAITKAEARVEADYTSETWSPFKAALDKAIAVDKDPSTKSAVQDATKKLNNAMSGLVEVEALELHEAVKDYKKVKDIFTEKWIVNVNIKDAYKDQVESVSVQGEVANKVSDTQWRVVFEVKPELVDSDIQVKIKKSDSTELHEAVKDYKKVKDIFTEKWIVNVNIKDAYKDQVESVNVQDKAANKVSDTQWRAVFEVEPELTNADIGVTLESKEIVDPIEKATASLGLFEDTTVKVWTKEGITITKVTANGEEPKEEPKKTENGKIYTIKLMGLKEGDTVKIVVTTPDGESGRDVTIEKL